MALHQARKAAKRARYASEAMAPTLGMKASRFAKQMKKVQSVLGDHQDTVIARQVERELGISAHLAGENAFSYRMLYGRDVYDGERLLGQAWRTWNRVALATGGGCTSISGHCCGAGARSFSAMPKRLRNGIR